ncbi:hypothetical protein [Streptomyces sp. 8P21H-1]|uniref:hypothetical protein n=1 Tax=Streptomyces sp. 8P21H-1 TaxID=2737048 RepID=UPI001570C7A8|nr:hypothetical protein [Streptomyces sp. 8P21H-1]NSL43633.1 hypothetical protein [Streptomyces sp. 8P21H-1]
MPSVLGLMEQREARARQDLEFWTEVLEQAQAEVDAAQQRVERAQVGREELVSVLAGESPVDTPVPVPSGGEMVAARPPMPRSSSTSWRTPSCTRSSASLQLTGVVQRLPPQTGQLK